MGLDLEAIGALFLLPLVEVAWADGIIQPGEQRRIIVVAQAWDPGEEAMILVRSWLRYRPTEAYCARGRQALAELLTEGAPQFGPWQADSLLDEARAVANASGGWLPFLRVSASERAVLGKLEKALGSKVHAVSEAVGCHPDLDRAINPVTLDFDTNTLDIEASGGVLIPDFGRPLRYDVPESGLVFGSGEVADLRVLDCPTIASAHCRLHLRNGRFYVQEMEGETRVNGERVLERRLLGGETLRLALDCTFAFKRVRRIPAQVLA